MTKEYFEKAIQPLYDMPLHRQKNLICMWNTLFYLGDSDFYDTDFSSYKRDIFDISIRTPMMNIYNIMFPYLFIQKGKGTFKKSEFIEDWLPIRNDIMRKIGYSESDFNSDYETFIIGRKLKKLRGDYTKKEFSAKTGLSIAKISMIENQCYNAKMKDIIIYCEKGLRHNFCSAMIAITPSAREYLSTNVAKVFNQSIKDKINSL